MWGKCCTCHAKVALDAESAAPATQKQPVPRGDQARTSTSQTVKVPRLPRKSSARCTKCCTCHAKVVVDAQSAAPATQQQPVPRGDQARTSTSQTVKVPRLPRKSSARCTKCCTCHAKVVVDAQSAAPATQQQLRCVV